MSSKPKPKAKRKSNLKAKSKTKNAAPKSRPAAKTKRHAKPQPVPAGYHSVTPYLIVHDAARAIEFYKAAFGAKEVMRMAAPNGKVGHAELKIGDSKIMLADESPSWNAHGPRKFGGTPVSIMLYVKNVDDVVAKAVAGGAKITRPIKDQFYGDRTGSVEDPYGHQWHVATHIEDVSKQEMGRRMAEAMKAMTPPQPAERSS